MKEESAGENKEAEGGEGKVSMKSLMEDDEFLIKWSGPMLLGPFLPAIFALITIFCGHIILNTWTGSCSYALDGFVSAAMAVCYIFLMVYSWAFVGLKVWFSIPFTGLGFYILKPFSKLKILMIWYFVVFFLSFIVWIVGTSLLDLSVFCVTTAPLLYRFTAFLVVTYWLGFCVMMIFLIKKRFGAFLRTMFDTARAGPTVEDMEERIFRKEFKKLDVRKKGSINPDFLPELFKQTGVFVPEDQMAGVVAKVGKNDADEIDFYPLLNWFREYNRQTSGYANAGADDDNDDDLASPKKKASEKKLAVEKQPSVKAKNLDDTNLEDIEDEQF